jgi:AraC-like DNA-binding protein
MWTMRSLLMAPAIRSLRVGVSFIPRTQPDAWFPVVADPRRVSLVDFEVLYGLERARGAYNEACLAIVQRTGKTHVAHRGGLCDLFVPVAWKGRLNGVLVCGPVVTRRPTVASLLDDFRALGAPSPDRQDETFLRYLRSVLDSHVFEGPALTALVRYVEDFAENMSGAAPTERRIGEDVDDWNALRRHVAEARRWDVAAELIDPEKNLVWIGARKDLELASEGLCETPNRVAVVVPQQSSADAAEVMLEVDRLQRVSAAFAAKEPNTLGGRTAEGAFFLVHAQPGRGLLDFARRAIRRLGIDVACGLSPESRHRGELPERYDQALGAALFGVAHGQAITLHSDLPDDGASGGLHRSARALVRSFELADRRETGLAAERVVREAFRVSDGNVGALRAHTLDAVGEILAALERREIVDRRMGADMARRFADRLRRSRTMVDVSAAFQAIVRELALLTARPDARGTRAKLERARRLVEQADRGTRIDLESLAREVGLSASYFSRTFKKMFGTTFARFVVLTRIERSKTLLRSTTLGAGQISAEVGWSSPSYFHQAFKREAGMTPLGYRATAGKPFLEANQSKL